MKNFKTTTAKGREGFNISYSAEEECASKLLKALPKGWKVSFSWLQILFSDVQYEIDFKKKEVKIVYNQNLHQWCNELVEEITEKVKEGE